MSKIKQLPDDIIAKIAAGEVIERPSYAVKELIDNAIDAHASVIEILIEESGLKTITVQDNGEGMTQEELKLSFLPHTTSKLPDDLSLIGIKTFGFRGEALSSIAAISQLTIQSRTPDCSTGTKITINNGVIESITPIGTPAGTIVTVKNLFHTIPARKKFLKSSKTELRHITETVIHFALSFPSIHFILKHNKKILLDLPVRNTNEERIHALLGASFFDKLLPLTYEENYIKVSGFIGHPQIASKQNQKQFLFVNNRHISDKSISLAAREAFGTLLSSANTPVFILHITIPHEMVDVNVHPRKEQTTFTDQQGMFQTIKQAVTDTLKEHNITFRLAKFKYDNSALLGETTTFSGDILKNNVLTPEKTSPGKLLSYASLIQFEKTYIVTLTKKGVLIIDQHAAHERILFEKFSHVFLQQKRKAETYELPQPIHISLALTDMQLLEEHISHFESLGFSIEFFSGNSLLIRNVPVIFKGRNVQKIIQDMFDDLQTSGSVKQIDMRSTRMIAFLSCRAAVKSGDTLSEKEMRSIVKELEDTPHNETCPHGRPVQIELSNQELDIAFKRK